MADDLLEAMRLIIAAERMEIRGASYTVDGLMELLQERGLKIFSHDDFRTYSCVHGMQDWWDAQPLYPGAPEADDGAD